MSTLRNVLIGAALATTTLISTARADFFDDARRTFTSDIPHFFQDDIPCAFGGRPTSHTRTSCKSDHADKTPKPAPKGAAAAPSSRQGVTPVGR